jgi:dTMP kinase
MRISIVIFIALGRIDWTQSPISIIGFYAIIIYMTLDNFIVLEGCDGAGTTTQRNLLRDRLIDRLSGSQEKSGGDRKITVFDTFEPTGSPIGCLLRDALSKKHELCPETLTYLFSADRCEHIYGKNGILWHCKRGGITICDRYLLSTLVYQGILCGDELPLRLNSTFPMPRLLLFFDLEPETAFARIERRGQKKEIYEYAEFQTAVRARYKKLLPWCREAGSEVVIIDACAPIDEVAQKVWSAVNSQILEPLAK